MNTKNTLIAIVALLATTATFAQVGIGTKTPDASAILDVKDTTKGFLPPRMTDAQRNAIGTPADGLTIFNTTVNCLQWYNGIGWFDGCDGSTFVAPVLGSGFTNGFQNNNTCATKVISVTPCSVVTGATQSSSQPHANGTLYDWTDAGSYMSGGTANALVEIGGQCWFGRNSNTPSPHTGTNSFDGYYNNAASEPAVGEGRLYQWDAAMNGSTTERAQGVCPTGWHVPSDCEWMYLENTLGMSTTAQQTINWRTDGNVGTKLSSLTTSGTNSSGFTGLMPGYLTGTLNSASRGTRQYWWSSSAVSGAAKVRYMYSSPFGNGVNREDFTTNHAFSIRCLKD